MRNITSVSELKGISGKTIVKFTATWCGPCKQIQPVYEKLEKEYSNLTFAIVDVDASSDVSQHYGVSSMPTFIVMDKGVALDQSKGASATQLRHLCEKHKGASSFTGTGHRLGGPPTVKQGHSLQPPTFITSILVFFLPVILLVVYNYIFQ